jgi:hypothetical protein
VGAWAWLGWWGLVPVGLVSIITIGYVGFILLALLLFVPRG